MACIVFQTNRKSGIKYAYESFSYWDKDKKQARSKRKYIGRVDPETGEIITSEYKKSSTANAGQNGDNASTLIISKLQEELAEKDSQIDMLKNELANLTAKYKKADKLIKKFASLATGFTEETDV
jgi:molecular chaperone GrpE (heat shock protein)